MESVGGTGKQFRVTDSGHRLSELGNQLRHHPAVTVGLNLVGGHVGVCNGTDAAVHSGRGGLTRPMCGTMSHDGCCVWF